MTKEEDNYSRLENRLETRSTRQASKSRLVGRQRVAQRRTSALLPWKLAGQARLRAGTYDGGALYVAAPALRRLRYVCGRKHGLCSSSHLVTSEHERQNALNIPHLSKQAIPSTIFLRPTILPMQKNAGINLRHDGHSDNLVRRRGLRHQHSVFFLV